MKKLILYFTEFFISKRLHIGLVAYVSVLYFMRCLPKTADSFNPLIPVVAFFIAWSAYLENLTTDRTEDKLNRIPHGVSLLIESTLYPLEKFYPLFYLIALILSLLVNVKCFLSAFIAVLIWLSYVHRWLPVARNKRKRLKEVYIIKNFIPPLGWLFTIGIMPFVASGSRFIPEYSVLILTGIFFALREEIKFDIPDTQGDKASGIMTLPNTIGEAATKKILEIINYLLILMLFLALLLLYQNQHIIEFKYLFTNILPVLTVFAYDQSFTDKLFEKRKKEYCNIGIIWWSFLIIVYLILSWPYNISVFLFLRLAGNFSGYGLIDGYLNKVKSKGF